MKTKFDIKNPCDENWKNMTPTDNGAYCDKCQLEVIDFTSMLPEEIRDILKSNSGKRTCGHISRTQIELVNSGYHVWENQTARVFNSKFLYACYIVFGIGLFCGCDNPEEEHDVGDIEKVIDGGMEVIDNDTASCEIIDGEIEMGGMEAVKLEEENNE